MATPPPIDPNLITLARLPLAPLAVVFLTTDTTFEVRSVQDGSLFWSHLFTDLPTGYAVATEAAEGGDGALWVTLRSREGSQRRALAFRSGSGTGATVE